MNLTRYGSALVSGWIAAEALLLFAAPAMLPDAPFADLVSAPDSIVWAVDDDTTLWLSTNLHDVEMHIDSVALGIGEINRVQPGTGETQRLGEGLGCQEWAVSSLSATVSSAGAVTWTAGILRGGYTGDAVVHVRARGPGNDQGAEYTLSGSDAELERTWNLGTAGEGVWTIDVSSNEHFPPAITLSITADTETQATTTDEDVEFLLMLENTGVTLTACSEDEDVGIRLVSSDGEELNLYLIDVGPAPTATPVPTATPNPDAGYVRRRVCVDDASEQALYLDGGEKVGAAFDHDDFGLANDIDSAVIGDVDQENAFRYFFDQTLATGSLQLLVSDVGADNMLGLDADRVYPVVITAKDDTGASKYLEVGVWLDTSTLSPSDDGLCS